MDLWKDETHLNILSMPIFFKFLFIRNDFCGIINKTVRVPYYEIIKLKIMTKNKSNEK